MMTLWHGTRGILMLAKNQVASQLRRFNVHENAVYYRVGIIPKYAPWLVYWCNCTFHNIALSGIIGLPLFSAKYNLQSKAPRICTELGICCAVWPGPLVPWRSIFMCNKSTSAGTSLESSLMFAHVTLHRTFNPLGSKCPWWQDFETAS